MADICPRCGGREIGCPTCELPPRHIQPKQKLSYRVLASLALLPKVTTTWEVQGIDVSSWNGVMDFSITKTKCQYVIARLGYGNQWKDYRCDTYRQDIIAQDIPYAVYWYAKAGLNWEAMADSFVETASQFPYQLDTIIDAEETLLDPTDTLNWYVNLDSRLRLLTGKIPMIYSSKGFWDSCVAPSTYFRDNLKHVANWTLGNYPYVPNGWLWNRWQWSADGNGRAAEYGMVRDGDPDMDLNRESLTVNQFNALYGTHIRPIGDTPPVPPGDLPDYFLVNTSSLNIRKTADARSTANIIGATKYGKTWRPIELVYGPDIDGAIKEWWRINEYAYVAKWLTRLP